MVGAGIFSVLGVVADLEMVYRRATGRTFKKILRQTGHLPGAATRANE